MRRPARARPAPKGGEVSGYRLGRTVLTEEQIGRRVDELAGEITADYGGRDNLLLLGILKGAFIFMSDLARRIDLPVTIDFMALSSYGSYTKTSGIVRVKKDLDGDLEGRHVLIVEDIVDTGLTLSYLVRNIMARKAASVEVCALLNKQVADKVDVRIKYEGFAIPDVFVVGYGLDYAEMYRNLPYVAELER